jgi:hypothetical protein
MRSIQVFAVSLVFLFASVAEAVTITSVSPATGPTNGGTQVTIKGTAFGTCPNCSPALPPFVSFGDGPMVMSQMVDTTTLIVTTPPHPSGTVNVRVSQWDGEAELPNAFTYAGDFPADAMERILLPLLTPPVFGGFGSEFHTDLRIEQRWPVSIAPVTIYGLKPACHLSPCPPWDPNHGLAVHSGSPIVSADLVADGSPGRFMYVDDHQVDLLTMNLRVHDVSRASLNFGTEMPIVRERDFIDPFQEIVLIGVPSGPAFRNTLRIYGSKAGRATITVEGEEPQYVELQGGSSPFEPVYAIFGDFPPGDTTPRRVTISLDNGSGSPALRAPFWAFITVTNAETQMITTITPQP